MFVAYIGLAVLIGFLMGSFNLPEYFRLAREGRASSAIVTATDCGNHLNFSYKFAVGEAAYTGKGGAGFGTAACSELRPGDAVVVYYLPARPETNVPGDIRNRLENEVTSVLGAALLGPAFLIGLVMWQLKRLADEKDD